MTETEIIGALIMVCGVFVFLFRDMLMGLMGCVIGLAMMWVG